MPSSYRTTIAGVLGSIAVGMVGLGTGPVAAAGHILLGVALLLGFVAAADSAQLPPKS